MIGLLGAINIPFYEEMARRIHWWQYQRLPNDFVYAVVHHSRRVRYRARLRVARANTATRFVAPGCYRWNRRRIVDLCLLRRRVLDYGSIGHVGQIVRRSKTARHNSSSVVTVTDYSRLIPVIFQSLYRLGARGFVVIEPRHVFDLRSSHVVIIRPIRKIHEDPAGFCRHADTGNLFVRKTGSLL